MNFVINAEHSNEDAICKGIYEKGIDMIDSYCKSSKWFSRENFNEEVYMK